MLVPFTDPPVFVVPVFVVVPVTVPPAPLEGTVGVLCAFVGAMLVPFTEVPVLVVVGP